MTSPTNSRYGLTFARAIAMTAAIAVSVWAKGNGQQVAMATEVIGIDVSALHASADVANLPVVYYADPF